LQDSAAGRKELTAANLEYLARINEKVARINIQKSNRVRSRLRKMPEFVGLPDRFPDVIAPPSYGSRLPDGFDLEKPPR
jgi:hypothetical protein